jgi:hypothetical protein
VILRESLNITVAGQYIQVAVTISSEVGSEGTSVDPWSNCPSETARNEGRICNKCEFWGREVQAIDWSEFSLCLFDSNTIVDGEHG